MGKQAMTWIDFAEKHLKINLDEVTVDRWGELFHDSSKLGDHHMCDMEKKDFDEAVENGVLPCSRCYPNLFSMRQKYFETMLD